MRRTYLLAPLAIVLTSRAVAQQAVSDPLCVGLDLAVAAAAEDRPFLSLVPEGQTLGSLPALKKNPAGFEEFKGCQIYRAGNSRDGVIGGGPYNYFSCAAVQIFGNTGGEAVATDAHAKLAARVAACMTPDGWTASEAVRARKYEDYETVVSIMRNDRQNHGAVELITGQSESGLALVIDDVVCIPDGAQPQSQATQAAVVRLFRTGARRSSGRS